VKVRSVNLIQGDESEMGNSFSNFSRIELSNIPCLCIKPNINDDIYPTIFLYHGWSSNKEKHRLLASILSQNGYQVIIPDAIFHGERNPLNFESQKALEENIWNVIIQSVKESTDLIREAIEKESANHSRICVMGHSMGGFSASGIFANNSEVKCLVSINGSSAWEKAEEIFRLLDGREPASDDDLKETRMYDPLRKYNQFNNRSMLLLHGDADTSVPIDSQRYFYKEISPYYSDNPDKLKLIEIPKLNHFITIGMVDEILKWLEENL